MTGEHGAVFVAMAEQELVGCAGLDIFAEFAVLRNGHVSRQGAGVGGALGSRHQPREIQRLVFVAISERRFAEPGVQAGGETPM